jgi:homocysteine S-methyltransferase
MATRLHNEVPGIVVPEHVQQRLRDAGASVVDVGLELARSLVEEARERAVAGIYVIPPFKQPEAALDLFA